MLAQVGKVQIFTVFDIAEEPNITAVKNLVQGGDNALNTRVIRGYTVANQPEGSGVTVKNVDRNLNGSRAYFLRFGEQIGDVFFLSKFTHRASLALTSLLILAVMPEQTQET